MPDPSTQPVTVEVSVPSEPWTSPAPSSPSKSAAAPNEGNGRGKNRFSLNALRLSFSSPRKRSVDLIKQDAESPTSSSSAVLASSSTAATVASPAGDEESAPANMLRPKRSALAAPTDASSSSAARAVSPHRVSFSPSTEEKADARDQALSRATPGNDRVEQEQAAGMKGKRNDVHPSKSKGDLKPGKWRGFKSHSTSDLTTATRRLSVDSTVSDDSVASSSAVERIETAAALPGPAAAKRRLFRWDRKGIRPAGAASKGRVAKVKVTKTQATAARHARTLEQVINAGMGLSPDMPRQRSAPEGDASEVGSPGKGGKKKVARAKPVPVVKKSELNGLKSALLDAKKANNIITELRAMPVPANMVPAGQNRAVSNAKVGTAGEHGEERILSAKLPDSVLQGTKDDSEIRKRSGATAAALEASTPARPPIERKAKSAAEEALRRITLQADATTSPQKALVSARTSSLPPTAEDAVAPPPTAQPDTAPATATKTGSVSAGPRPLKVVCLDCGEKEAHQRHAQHLEAASVIKDGATPAQTGGGFNVAAIASGAGAAIVGVGAILGARSAATPAEASPVTANAQSTSARPAMVKSMSVANLPSLQDAPRLMGSTPLQLLMDPVGTAAQNSGAFDMLADVSGAAIRATQDMENIHPPLDRMAIFVHWWGFEITLPKASMAYLGTAHSVSGAFLSFLQTMAVGGGVPELLPFIKYISTYMEVEYKAIQAQDQGNGVCIAGTWFMPMALVPRPWDYPLDGPIAEKPGTGPPALPASTATGQSGVPALMPMPARLSDAAASPKKHILKKKKPAVTGQAISAT